MNKPVYIHDHLASSFKEKKKINVRQYNLQIYKTVLKRKEECKHFSQRKKIEIMGGKMKGLVKNHLIRQKIPFGYNGWHEITYFNKEKNLGSNHPNNSSNLC